MKINTVIKGPCLVIPSEPVINSLSDCSGDYLKVLLYVYNNNEFIEQKICEDLNITKKTLTNSLNYWTNKGLIEVHNLNIENKDNIKPILNPANEIKKYSVDEISNFLENDKTFESLLYACQNTLGKIFNQAEIEILISLVDFLKLDYEYIILVFSHCKKIEKTSLRYIQKLCISLHDDGILTYDELDSYLTSLEKSNIIITKLRKLFGINRKLTNKEEEFFKKWTIDYNFSYEIIEKAFEITIDNTGSISIPYCNAVIDNWNKNGYSTLDEINEAMEKYKLDKENSMLNKSSFDTDDFFEAALKRSYSK